MKQQTRIKKDLMTGIQQKMKSFSFGKQLFSKVAQESTSLAKKMSSEKLINRNSILNVNHASDLGSIDNSLSSSRSAHSVNTLTGTNKEHRIRFMDDKQNQIGPMSLTATNF